MLQVVGELPPGTTAVTGSSSGTAPPVPNAPAAMEAAAASLGKTYRDDNPKGCHVNKMTCSYAG